ncbi:dnaJ homolog subfamily C member 3 isoform X2 [Chrysoperla carnea]|uniref:dnaJ homolog subfamily C member 3 isoform X2 n=1 Tax=Chrysoperla carnea TaxID=189513 RepID=UPI001D072325|nr:dnaJ homolog subfamily C member 3 isoform X2 [Chrysoperla carnea]
MFYMDHLNILVNLKVAPYIMLLAFDVILDNFDCATQAEIDSHLELGREFLAKGQLADALTQYHAAVEGDPNNYLTYFKRGTIYLALGKARLALTDLDRTIDLKPDFMAARLSRGTVYYKLCDLEHAQIDLMAVYKKDPSNFKAQELLRSIALIEEYIDAIHAYYASGDYSSAIMYLNKIVESCPWSSKYRKLRADCYLELGENGLAVSDLRSTTKLEADNTDGYLELSKLIYKLGEVSEALKEIRECLKLDPEHDECFPFYKKIKKIDKFLTEADEELQKGNYAECVENAQKVLKNEKYENMVKFRSKQLLCTCLMKDEKTSSAISACREALDLSKDPDVYCDRAEAYLQAEMYDDAIRDYHAALEMHENFQRAKDGLQKAQKLQTQAERRDYYKILGVKRTATKKEIVKAYRKAAQKWHPDNFESKSDEEKKIAEKKFIDIAAAKEVLTDEEKRAQFDSGDDPLDPEQNANRHGGNPFHHFHQGSPFQFRFHFN